MTKLLAVVVAWLALVSAGRAGDVFLKADAADTATAGGVKLAAEVSRLKSEYGTRGLLSVVLIVENVGDKDVTVRGWYYGQKDIEDHIGRGLVNTGRPVPANTDADGLELIAYTGTAAKASRPWMRVVAVKGAGAPARSYTVKPGTRCKIGLSFPPATGDVFQLVVPGENLGVKGETFKLSFVVKDIEDKR